MLLWCSHTCQCKGSICSSGVKHMPHYRDIVGLNPGRFFQHLFSLIYSLFSVEDPKSGHSMRCNFTDFPIFMKNVQCSAAWGKAVLKCMECTKNGVDVVQNKKLPKLHSLRCPYIGEWKLCHLPGFKPTISGLCIISSTTVLQILPNVGIWVSSPVTKPALQFFLFAAPVPGNNCWWCDW